jgi:hypothetical protein
MWCWMHGSAKRRSGSTRTGRCSHARRHGPVENVARATLGVSRDFRVSDTLVIAVGASATQNWTSGALSPLYDGDPSAALAFVRFKIE